MSYTGSLKPVKVVTLPALPAVEVAGMRAMPMPREQLLIFEANPTELVLDKVPQPRLPNNTNRAHLLLALQYGIPALTQQIRRDWSIPNFPELHILNAMGPLLKPMHAKAASFPEAGFMLFAEEGLIEPYSLWHEIAHVLQKASGVVSDETWCNQFAEIMVER